MTKVRDYPPPPPDPSYCLNPGPPAWASTIGLICWVGLVMWLTYAFLHAGG